jgi:hypothetical protein
MKRATYITRIPKTYYRTSRRKRKDKKQKKKLIRSETKEKYN